MVGANMPNWLLKWETMPVTGDHPARLAVLSRSRDPVTKRLASAAAIVQDGALHREHTLENMA